MTTWLVATVRNFWHEAGLGEGDRLNCMFDGFLCAHLSMNLNYWRCCCVSSCECLCIRHTACCLRGAPYKDVGLTTNNSAGEYCRLSFPCCDCAVVPPRLMCARASQCFCLYNAGSLPLHDDYVAEPVCAYYFLSCWPRLGFCATPPRSKALEKLLNPGVEHIEALDQVPDGQEIERTAFERLKRKDSDDGLDDFVLALDVDESERSPADRHRRKQNHVDGTEMVVV